MPGASCPRGMICPLPRGFDLRDCALASKGTALRAETGVSEAETPVRAAGGNRIVRVPSREAARSELSDLHC
jgi:hypothetical protein